MKAAVSDRQVGRHQQALRVFSFQSVQPVFAILIPAHVSAAGGAAQIENGDA